MLGSASPRKPSVRIAPRSAAVAILLAAELNRDGDAPGVGVQCVLEQLLDDRRRAFDNFAGSDLIGEIRREAVDAGHDGTKIHYPGTIFGGGRLQPAC